MRRWLLRAALVVLSIMAGVPAMAKQITTVELFYSSSWHDHTADLHDRYSITINHAILDGQSGLAPSDASVIFQIRDGRLNPDNRLSPLFGLIGEGTPIRISSGSDIRFSGKASSWAPERTLGGAKFDAWVTVTAQNTLRRLGQGDPPQESPLFRTMSAPASGEFAPLEYWSLEDGKDAKQFASAVGGRPGIGVVTVNGEDPPVPAGHSGIPGSAASVLLPLASLVRMPVRPYADTGRWVIPAAFVMDDFDATGSINVALGNGGQVVVSVTDDFDPGVSQSLVAEVFDANGSLVYGAETSLTGGNLLGEAFLLMVADVDTGAGTDDFTARVIDGDGTVRAQLTTTDIGYSMPTAIEVEAGGGIVDKPVMGASHVGLFVDAAFDVDVDTIGLARAVSGWADELAGDRFIRLCGELHISATIVGSAASTQRMGRQPVETSLGLFSEIARTDGGYIFDTREQDGLTLRTGRSLNNQAAAVTFYWSAGNIGAPLKPKLDDSGRANVVTVKQRDGSQATDSDATGRLGVASVGTYKLPVEVNLADEAQLPQHAHYYLVLGTDPSARYTQVVADLDANPALAAAVSAVDVADLLALQGIPAELGQPSAELLALGYQEVIRSHRRVITFNAKQGAILSHVGKLDANGGLQTAGAELPAAITDQQTSFTVATTSGPLFTTSPPASAKIVIRGREVVSVVSISGVSSPQTFTVVRRPGERMAHPAGASVEVYQPIRLTL